MWIFCIVNAIYHIQYSSFPCRYRQNTGFAGLWEWATLTRRREPSSPVTRTHRLMKQPTAQYGGARMEHVTVERVIMAAVMFMFIILNILIDPSQFFLFPRRYDKVKQPYVYQNWSSFYKSMYNPVSNKANPCPASHTLPKSSYFCICIYPQNLQGSRCGHSIPNTRVSNISKPCTAALPCSTTSPIAMLHYITHTKNSRMTVQIRNACSILQQHITYPLQTFQIFSLHNPGQLEFNLKWPFNHPNCNKWLRCYVIWKTAHHRIYCIRLTYLDSIWIEKPIIIGCIVFA